ncbi:urease accessory protein UreF [Catenuloplanes sp. NPDC051500]|uniref:urease accessory protein UreF n=1 Tax=Catenuloplanes sp. NPDC051500 TaxID=3363959 RepID=UPI003792CF09
MTTDDRPGTASEGRPVIAAGLDAAEPAARGSVAAGPVAAEPAAAEPAAGGPVARGPAAAASVAAGPAAAGSVATLLVLADGRLPAGGHAHSSGLEAQVSVGRIRGLPDLEAFLRGRLATGGLVASAFAACTRTHAVEDLDRAFEVRTPSPALRHASRAQGKALLRAGRAMWPVPALHRADVHQPVALGVVAAAAGLAPEQAAVAAAWGTISGPASAAVRLLGLDPYGVHALLARLASDCDAIAARAMTYLEKSLDDLPADGAPLLDIGAEHHATWEVRLFAS